MGLRIQNNVEAFNTHRQLTATGVAASKSMEKLSSGYRINRAADDAAGLGISEKMRAQIRGNRQAIRNAQDGISMIQTAEGAMDEVHGILQRMRELGVQAANDTYDAAARTSIGTELLQLRYEIDRIANATQFNGQNLGKRGFADRRVFAWTAAFSGPHRCGTAAAASESLGHRRQEP